MLNELSNLLIINQTIKYYKFKNAISKIFIKWWGMSFKENLKEAMYCKNLTTVQLAALTDINSGTISSYLKTKNSMPPVDKALKLAKALDVSVDFLVNGFESKTESSIQQKSPFSLEVFKIAQKMEGFDKDELSIVTNLIDFIRKKKM